MRARVLFLTLLLLSIMALPTSGQVGGEKSQPPVVKKETKISADTEINGKTLDEWIKLIPGSDRSKTEVAIKSIVLYGPELANKAVPAMIAELKKHPSVKIIDMSVRTNIPMPLAMILSSVANPDPNDVKETVEVLRKMVKDPQVIVRFRALQAIAQLGPLAKEAIPDLVIQSRDFDYTWEIRELAVVALGTIAQQQNPANVQGNVVDALFARLQASETAVKVRLAALQALNRLAVSQAKEYQVRYQVNVQRMANEDVDSVGRVRAHLALYTLTADADKAKRRQSLASFLDHKDPLVRVEAAQALGRLGPEARDQVPRLIRALNDKELVVVGWSMWALGHIKDASALAALQAKAADTTLPVEFLDTAREAIANIMGIAKEEPKKGNEKR